jgi:glycosyltransferase involved in cell wall biosynthesis
MFMLIALYGKCLKKKVYITFHGEDFQRIRTSKIYATVEGIFDAVFTISPTTIPRLKEIHKAPVNLVFNGFDPSFKSLGLTRKKQIIFVGSFKPVKAHSLMLEGFEKFISNPEFSDYNLLFVGDGPLKEEIEKVALAKGINEQVIFVGQKTSEELIKLYNESEIFALTSLREGFPKVILEALGCGCKIVSTKVGSVPDILSANYSYFIEDHSAEAVCNALIKIAAASEDFSKYQKIPHNYTWEALRTIYKNQYDTDLCLTH